MNVCNQNRDTVMTAESAVMECKCGAGRDDVAVRGRRGWAGMCYRVSCGKCGKESLEHADVDTAIVEWNWMQTHDVETGDYTGQGKEIAIP